MVSSEVSKSLPRVVDRVAVAGISLAVVALGGLALWSTIVTKAQADDLNRMGVQVTGHLRAVQSLGIIRMETDALEDDYAQARLDRLRAAEVILSESLTRMESGDAQQVARVAIQARPLATELIPAIERFLADPKGDLHCEGEACDDTSEFAMGAKMTELATLLNDPRADPADLLAGKLATVTMADRAVRRATIVFIPLGLGGALASGWLLRLYRRRSESTMRAAIRMTAREARTDQLTGLPNRRALMEELQRRVDSGKAFLLAMADLNGFKPYNDTFGHPAGDDLLRRLGAKLDAAWQGHGFAARLGGDEFCVITPDLDVERLQTVLHEALSDEGDGFAIGAVSGVASVPAEATDPSAALGLADTRLYVAKAVVHAGSRAARDRLAALADASEDTTAHGLLRMLEECHPGLGKNADRVAELAASYAEALELPSDQSALIERAARLHDVGKVAIPTAILTKPGPLSDEEWQFMRGHSIIGERILSRVDSDIAGIVRAIHERWDGTGYPDNLSGDDIPLGARIVAVADAFVAMTGERPYAGARSVDDAVRELRQCAGTQFDATVVAALTDIATAQAKAGPPVPAGRR